MAWNAGVDVTTGDLITAAQWNNYLGASGSLEYLKNWTQNNVTGSRAIDGTAYQNTTDKIMLIVVTAYESSDDMVSLTASTDANATPTTAVAISRVDFITGGSTAYVCLSFVVLPGNYYKMNSYNATLDKWFEWGA